MGKKLHNDDFENFFKNHLENFDGEPSDDMWSRIEPVIPEKSRSTWPSFLLPFALLFCSLLLIIVGNRMFEYKKNSEDLMEKLEQSNRDVQDLNERLTLQNEALLSTDAASITVSKANENIEKEQNTAAANSSFGNSSINFSQEKNTTTTSHKSQINPVNTANFLSEQPIIIDSVQQLEDADKTVPSSPMKQIDLYNLESNTKPTLKKTGPMAIIDDLHLLDMKHSTVHFQNNWELTSPILLEQPLPKDKSLPKNSIAFFVAPSILKNNIQPARPSIGGPPPPLNHPHPIPTEKVRLGRAIGVKYGIDISDKLTLNLAGMYARSMYGFSTRQLLRYRQDTETDISGNRAINTIDYLGESTYGEFGIDAEITRMKDNGIAQNDDINIKIDATANIHSIAVPVYLSYKIFEVEGLSIGLKAGLSYNNLIKNDLKINDFEIEQQGFEVQNTTLKARPVPSKKGGISTLTGVTLAYEFQENYALTIEPTWTSAISDNHQADFGRTKSSLFNIDVGLRYAF